MHQLNSITMNKCIVKAFEGKVVVISKNNPEYGSIRLEQTVMTTQNGFLTPKKRSAFLNGLVADLTATGWADGQGIDGHIVVKESLSPFNEDNPDSDIKMAGDTGVPCTSEGQAIYRKSYFSYSAEADTLISHDNGEQIKVAQAKLAEEALSEG
jgi:hypothetical protein